ncbi:MAG: DNA polymerase III subunit beta [Candidatus Paceibacterota bacterium]|jgi:DNA polymerase-3 subunit beta
MIIECSKDKLRTALVQTEKVANKNLSLPILEAVLIETKEKSILVKATNLDIGVEVEIPAKIERKGSVAISASLLNSYINATQDDGSPVKLSVNAGNVSITDKKSSAIIKGFPVDDFPIIPRVEKEQSFMITGRAFSAGIKSVSFSASISDMKPEISSVYITNDNNGLVFASTDSFRLAEKKIDVPNINDDISIIVPFKNANEITRIFGDSDDILEVGFNKNQLYLSSDNTYFTSRLVPGVFPDYKENECHHFKERFSRCLKSLKCFFG